MHETSDFSATKATHRGKIECAFTDGLGGLETGKIHGKKDLNGMPRVSRGNVTRRKKEKEVLFFTQPVIYTNPTLPSV
jgi:hypothetical protein